MDKSRNQLLDILKGISILLVLAGHSIQHGSGQTFIERTAYWNDAVFKAIYSFHMPLFMLISGYLFFFTLNRHPTKKIVASRFKTLLLPLFSFAVLSVLFSLMRMGSFHFSIPKLAALLSTTFFKNLWFLWAVFYCSFAVLLIKKLLKDSVIAYFLIFAISFFTPDILSFAKYKFMYPFFICGYLFNRYCAGKTLTFPKYKIFAFSGILFACLLPFYNSSSYIYITGYFVLNGAPLRQFGIDLYRMGIGFAGSIFVICLVKILVEKTQDTVLKKGLSFLGKNSLGIYALSEYVFAFVLPMLTAPLGGVNYLITFFEMMAISGICLLMALLLQKNRVTNTLFLGAR